MKKTSFSASLLLAAAAVTITACKKEAVLTDHLPASEQVAYVVNYGMWGGTKGEISVYDVVSKAITNEAYKVANSVEFSSNIQSIAIFGEKAYLMSNDGDKIDQLDAASLKASENPLSAGVVKPRYFVAEGNTAYISCWGDVQDWNAYESSYIAELDLTTNTISTIPLAGGCEGMVIANNKLYIALTAAKKIAVMDLISHQINYVTTLAVPQHFVKDANGMLWVSQISTFSVPVGADSVGVALLNPATDIIEENVNVAGISYLGQIHLSADKNKIFVLAYDGIYTIGINSHVVSDTPLVQRDQICGFGVNPTDGDIYSLRSISYTDPGKLEIYSQDGVLKDEETTGIGPQQVVFFTK